MSHRDQREADNVVTGVLAFSPTNSWDIGMTGANGIGFVMRWNDTDAIS